MLAVVSIPHSTWNLEGEKCLSIFISPLDLFWAVIKVHLPLRISIMISYTGIYEAHRLPGSTSTSVIKSAELWIYSKACMINEGKDPVQYPRLFHNFTTSSSALTVRNGQLRARRGLFSQEHLEYQYLLLFIMQRCHRIIQHQSDITVSVMETLVWRWKKSTTPGTSPPVSQEEVVCFSPQWLFLKSECKADILLKQSKQLQHPDDNDSQGISQEGQWLVSLSE